MLLWSAVVNNLVAQPMIAKCEMKSLADKAGVVQSALSLSLLVFLSTFSDFHCD